jgi:hypothetical protein
MKWFRPILAAMCAAVAVLALAGPGWSWPAPDPVPVAPEQMVNICQDDPGWFAPIHLYYNCDPKITPNYDFASLYSASAA